MTEPALKYGGRLVGTIEDAAERHGKSINAMQKALGLHPVPPVTKPDGRPLLGKRTPAFYLTDIDRMMGARPGKGANFRKAERTS